jgi:NhaA family Na+:H+ antiporter
MRGAIRKKIRASFVEFVQLESSGGVVLILATAISLFLANSPWSPDFQRLLQMDLSLPGIHLNLIHWVNDGLMAIFFLVAGAEIKRELVHGELSTFKKAAMPIAAAIGGMAVPALIYFLFNRGTPFVRGWGIPMATDIAFSLGILALLGSRIPLGLKVFLTALAIVDDLGAILVIAVFYSSSLGWGWLGMAGLLLGIAFVLRQFRVQSLVPFCLIGIGAWFCMLHSGIHATVAGVLVGLLIPASGKEQDESSSTNSVKGNPQSTVHNPQPESPIDRLIHSLHPWVAFAIVPIFALANAGVAFEGITVSALQQGVPLGIIAGLFVGKPIGILGFSWVASKLRFGDLPYGVSWSQVIGMAFLAGIGFTMSLFIAELAFSGSGSLPIAKFGILIASLISAAVGFVLLRSFSHSNQEILSESNSN